MSDCWFFQVLKQSPADEIKVKHIYFMHKCIPELMPVSNTRLISGYLFTLVFNTQHSAPKTHKYLHIRTYIHTN